MIVPARQTGKEGMAGRKTCRQQQKEEQGIQKRERKTRGYLVSYRGTYRGLEWSEKQEKGNERSAVQTNKEMDKRESGTPI